VWNLQHALATLDALFCAPKNMIVLTPHAHRLNELIRPDAYAAGEGTVQMKSVPIFPLRLSVLSHPRDPAANQDQPNFHIKSCEAEPAALADPLRN